MKHLEYMLLRPVTCTEYALEQLLLSSAKNDIQDPVLSINPPILLILQFLPQGWMLLINYGSENGCEVEVHGIAQ